ncbi:MAG TPA: hypothetical protein VHO91_09040 [Rhodopila sp.]|nr:hypothetical protein [Rhodopila sp.]
MNRHATMLTVTGALVAGTVMTATGGAAWAANGVTGWQDGNRATHALNMLEDQGYTRFSHFQASGQDFTADVVKDGRTMQVRINPDSDAIQPANAASTM